MEDTRERIQRLAYEVIDHVVNEKWMALQSSAAELADAVWRAEEANLTSARTPMLSCHKCGSTRFYEEGTATYSAEVCWPVDDETIDLLSDPEISHHWLHVEGTVGRREIIDIINSSYRCYTCETVYFDPIDMAAPAAVAK